MALIDRFLGEGGRRRLIDELLGSKLVDRVPALAEEIAARAEIMGVAAATVLIEQAADDNDVYVIVAGTADVIVNGRPVQVRSAGDHVGEMAAIMPAQPRSASIVAREDMVVAKLSESDFADIAARYPHVYRSIARELARRLYQRNAMIGAHRKEIRVFIISSVEALGVARTIQAAFEHDPFHVEIWTDGTFKVTSYTLDALEDEVDRSDFAIAIAHADDITESRNQAWPTPRDNVVFELGLFMGRLGRKRAILMEPRDEKVRLPSDLAGVTTIPYKYAPGSAAGALMGPACTKLRAHIEELGANNG